MAVLKNTFSGVLSDTSTQTHTITGLTSETSTKNITYINQEASLHFLNALYKTLVDSGYGDTVKNETEYSITVLGFKFFVLVSAQSNFYIPNIYTYGTSSTFAYTSSNSGYTICVNSVLEYNITVRGDSNHVSIYYGSYNNPTTEYNLFSIAKGKNLITSSDIYMFGQGISNAKQSMREKNDLYNCFYNSTTNPLDKFIETKGLNTNSKFVCVPQLAYYNTCLIYSMIQGNGAIFTDGKYYKIGEEIYYDEGGYLYKVG